MTSEEGGGVFSSDCEQQKKDRCNILPSSRLLCFLCGGLKMDIITLLVQSLCSEGQVSGASGIGKLIAVWCGLLEYDKCVMLSSVPCAILVY